MKTISAVFLSVVMVGSSMILPSSQYTSSFVGISSAEAARGGRVTRSGSRGSVTRSAAAGPRGGAARTTVRTPRGTASRTVARTPYGAGARTVARTPYGSASRSVAVGRPAYRAPSRSYRYDRYDRYYSGGTVLAAGIAGLAVGAMVASIPPSCSTVFLNGIEYKRCGDTYYQQSFNGPDVVYIVVPAP